MRLSHVIVVHVPSLVVTCHHHLFMRTTTVSLDQNSMNPSEGSYWSRDPVWDGKGRPNKNSCCSEPNLPWFYRQIPLTSDQFIEARICCDESFLNEGVLVKEIKLFVQQL